jgi:hypothetical protein
MLIDEFDSIFEKRWTVTSANGESSVTFAMSATTFFSMLPDFPPRIPLELIQIPWRRISARCTGDRPRFARRCLRVAPADLVSTVSGNRDIN